MVRPLLKMSLPACLALVLVPPAGAQDRVLLKSDPKRPVTGAIQSESPKGVTLKGHDLIPADRILDVIYDVPGGIKLGFYIPALNSEADIDRPANQKKHLADAIRAYTALLNKLKGADYPGLRRNVEYKLAVLHARQAEVEKARPTTAIRELRAFVKDHADGWQTVPAARLLGELLVETRQNQEAEQMYDELAGKASLPEEARATFRLLAARALMGPGGYGKALEKLTALVDGLPKDSPQRARAEVYQAECLAETNKVGAAEQKLHAVLNAAKSDKGLRAAAYNALGRCHLLEKRYKDALWDFLRVDVVYNQNKEEQAQALYHLADLFDKLKDPDHANQCRARLRGSQFDGTDYQRRLLAEGAKGK